MNRKTFTLRLTAIMLTAVIGTSIAACGAKKEAESLEPSDASESITSITTTTEQSSNCSIFLEISAKGIQPNEAGKGIKNKYQGE